MIKYRAVSIKSLGKTAAEVYRNWAQAGHYPGMTVVGWVAGAGPFDWRNGRLFKTSRGRRGVAIAEPATPAELALIDEAIRRGWFQIEARPHSGVLGGQGGGGTIAQASWATVILHQATGRALGGDCFNQPDFTP